MRILLATAHPYLPQIVGGAELSTHVMCQQMKNCHHEVAVLAQLSPHGLFGLRSRILRKLSGSRFSTDRGLGYPAYRGWDLANDLPQVLPRFRADGVIVTMLGVQSLPLAIAAASTGLPTLVYVRNTGLKDCAMNFPRSAHVKFVANSNFTRDFLHKQFGLDAHVIPPIIVPNSYRTKTDRSHVIFINPHPSKGGDIAVAVAARLPQIPFLFVESWPLDHDVKAKYRQTLSACKNVRWLPPTADMRRIYRQAKFLIMPSRWEETWGRVATEAQVSAIPVIATHVGGLPESVGLGGILMPHSASVDDWVDAVARLWNDDSEYRRLCETAAAHSNRLEIQPAHLIEKIIDLLDGLRRSARLNANS